VIKHAHHDFDIDHPGKDTWRHREAGAREVILATGRRWALLHELRDRVVHSVHSLIAELHPAVDWVLVEGFKDSDLVKLEVWRQAHGKPVRYLADERIVAVVTDSPQALTAPTPRTVLDLNRPDDVALWLLDNADRFAYQAHPPSTTP